MEVRGENWEEMGEIEEGRERGLGKRKEGAYRVVKNIIRHYQLIKKLY